MSAKASKLVDEVPTSLARNPSVSGGRRSSTGTQTSTDEFFSEPEQNSSSAQDIGADERRVFATNLTSAPPHAPTSSPFATLRASTKPQPPSLLSQRILLGELIADGLPEIAYLATPTLEAEIFYEKALLLVAGHRKNGKTMLVGAVIKDRIEAGLPSLYLDFENGKHRIARRLEDMGLDPEAIDEHLIYISSPAVTLSTFYEELKSVLCEYPKLLIVVDSWRGLGARLSSEITGFNQNDTLQMEQLLDPLRNIVTQDEATVIVLDHPNRSTTETSSYLASNSVAKEQIVDAIYWVQQEEPYSVDREGLLSIQVHHDRDGRLTREKLQYRLGGQGPKGTLTLTPAAAHEVGQAPRIAAELKAWLRENAAGSEKAKSQHAIETAKVAEDGVEVKAIKGAATEIRAALKHLAEDPDEPVARANRKYFYAEQPSV